MHFSENEGIEGKTFLVTGGLGHVGSALCLDLLRRGAYEVRAFDLRTTSPWYHLLHHKGVVFIQGDITKKKDVERAVRGADCVFHIASYGMSGKEMLQLSRVDEVNINGTCHVIEACVEFGIKRLVYVSTYNVVFGGKEIVNGNESLPYFPIDDHVDSYGRSKSIAEQLVLKSNGRPFKTIGYPVNTFEFIEPLLKSLDYDLPKSRLAVTRALFLGKIFSVFYSILYPWLNRWWLPQPLILPAEVYKVGVTHYFSFLKAKEELGYVPMVSPREGMAATISYWQERKRKSLDGPTIYAWLFCAIGMSTLFCAAFLPDIGPVPLFRAYQSFLHAVDSDNKNGIHSCCSSTHR
ncbi:hypothetical protein Pint_09179 [Pistacia integerrima]|uniref:Uncharacterized protein n=1 Tax=Pistacia integerrima TaxID=434235 RepID=A0ACC0XXC5_9ROSI|nr:hypothetical protein Pint_09179 [Pistacia integerrima]